MSNNLKSFYSLYTFDMRALDTPVMVHMDHVSAVLDVDYSPTGKEFVSASFDKSIRIFPVDKSRSRYVITNKHLFVIFFFFLDPHLSFLKSYLIVCLWWGSHYVLWLGVPTSSASSMAEHQPTGQFLHWTGYYLYIIHCREILVFALE